MQDRLASTRKRRNRADSGSERPSLIGRQLGSYKILALLGSGGMGEVYRARDTRLDRTVALKVLTGEHAFERDAMNRFRREAKAASALNHPNICTVYEIGEGQGVRFIAMEHIEGTILSTWAAENRPDISSILDIAVHLADALDEAHGKGIIHRDIKPANLIVSSRGVVKILDFGLAKIRRTEDQDGDSAKTSTQEGVVLGTVDYMSPEQVIGHELDARTDIFSLGTVLYQLATGKRPFAGSSATETMGQILHTQPESITEQNPAVPAEFERIIRKCLEKDRARRYQFAGELLVELKKLKRELDSGAHTSLNARRLGPVPMWGIALLSVLVLGALGYWLFRLGSHRESPDPVPLVFVPLTSYAGSESFASFSPDGSLVAFDWDGEHQANRDIYIKQLDSDGYSRLTDYPGWDGDPAWSPDGRSIAFIRETSTHKYSVVVKPPLGGLERVLAEIDFPLYLLWNRNVAWHPGGKWLVVPDRGARAGAAGLVLLSVETGEKRTVTSPPEGFAGDSGPAFSPDGRRLAFARYVSENVSDLHLLTLDERLQVVGEPVQLTSNHQSCGPEWTRDGSEIFYVSGSRHNPALWRLDPRYPQRPRPLPGMHRSFGPVFSAGGERMAFARLLTDVNIWQIERPAEGSGQPPPSVNLISSTYVDHTPQYSPDGAEIAFSSYRSGSPEIWVCAADGSAARQLTSFRGPETDLPAWSPDGKRIVFGSRAGGSDDIYVINPRGGKPERLTNDPSDDKGPSYSRDGRWIYFSSNRTGQAQIWRMPAEGGAAVQITKNGGLLPTESGDRKYVYYLKETTGHYFSSLWRMPVEGGEETRLVDTVYGNDYAVATEGIYFIPQPDPDWTIQFLDLRTQKVQRFAKLAKSVAWGFSMSPDERRFLYAQFDVEGFDLMLVEDFR